MTAPTPRPSRARAVKAAGRWEAFAERGTLGALRFVAWVYARLGRRAVRVML